MFSSVKVDIETLESILLLANKRLECYSNNDIVIDRKDDAQIVIDKIKLKNDIKAIYESFDYVDDDIAPVQANIEIEFCNY